jgi:hypothetical protein
MVGVCLGGGRREFITQWFHWLQRDIRHPSGRQHGVAAADSFAAASVHTRRRHSGVGGIIVRNAPAASTGAYGSGHGLREDREVNRLGLMLRICEGIWSRT